MTDDGMPGVAEALDEALMETHHLANLSGLDEARLARRRLVEAQSATSVERTRDRLEQATEYLELARLERRDTAASFVQARELVSYAEAGLQREQPVPLTGSPRDLVRSESEPEERRSLQELRAEAAVNSYEQLQYDVELEGTFREIQRQVRAGEIDHEPADDGDLDPESALELASLEVDIERTLQRSGDDSEFEFVADDDLEARDDADVAADAPETSSEEPDGPVDEDSRTRDGGVADDLTDAESDELTGADADELSEEVAEVLDEAAQILDDAEGDELDEEVADVLDVEGGAVEEADDVPDEIEIPDFEVAAPREGTDDCEAPPNDGEAPPDDAGDVTDEAAEPSGQVAEPSDDETSATDETGDQVAHPGER